MAPNVKLVVLTTGVLFTLLLGGAIYVGHLEGSFGCGGGTVGAMITLGGVVFGFLSGLAAKFADGFVAAKSGKK